MSTARLRSNVMGLVREMLNGEGHPRTGIVKDYDPIKRRVKVSLQPDDTETGWIPLRTCLAGPSFGVFVGPTNGLEAVVIFQDANLDVGICIGFLPNDEDVPPVVPAGQILLVDSAGASIAFTNDGRLTITAPHGAEIIAEVAVTGSVDVSGNLTVGNGASGSFTSAEGLTIAVQDGIVTNIY